MIRTRLAGFYDTYAGILLPIIFGLGLLFGGWLADRGGAIPEAVPVSGAQPQAPTDPQGEAVPAATPTPAPSPTPTLAPISGPTPIFAGAAPLEDGWSWLAPEPILFSPVILPNGVVNLVGESGTIYVLNPDGSPRALLTLPNYETFTSDYGLSVEFDEDGRALAIARQKVLAVGPDNTLLWEFAFHYDGESGFFTYKSGEVHYLLDGALTLYAYTAADGLLWHFPLENGLRDEYIEPEPGEAGGLYLTDRLGVLYAFNATGLAWSFDPGGLRSASDPTLGPDGNLYYVVTGGTRGTLLSVTPAGQERWRTNLETIRYYNQPVFTADGRHIRVGDNFVEAASGAFVPVAFPFEVRMFITGRDGHDYLLTGSHVIQWQIGPEGVETAQDVVVNLEGMESFQTPLIDVFETGVIQVQIFDQDGIQFSWIAPDGTVLTVQPLAYSQIRFVTNPGAAELVWCGQDLQARTVSCFKTGPESRNPIWEFTLSGIEGSVDGFQSPVVYQNGWLYLLAGFRDLYVIEVVIP